MKAQQSVIKNYLKEHWLLILFFVFATVLYTTYSWLRHWRYGSSGFDLGIFDQAIWHYSRFETPASTVRGVSNILADHFHPILILLAPLYWVTNRVEILLLAQAALFASAVFPIFLFSKKKLGARAAYLVSIAYLLYWGILQAAAYDFHEIAFAVPLIAWAIYWIEAERWRAYFITSILLLLTKEDQAFVVMALGVYLLWRRHFVQGGISLLLGGGWYALITGVVMPHIGGGYSHWSYDQLGSNPSSALSTVIRHPVSTLRLLTHPRVKVITGWYMFSPFLLLSFTSPLIILAFPLVGERFFSSNPNYWVRDFHYTATLAPVAVFAAADGLQRVGRIMKQSWFIIGAAGAMALCSVLLFHLVPQRALLDPRFYQREAWMNTGDQAIARIPATASVVAQDGIIPHLTHRTDIYQLQDSTPLPAAEYIIASEHISPWPVGNWQQISTLITEKEASGYTSIFRQDGWIVLQKPNL